MTKPGWRRWESTVNTELGLEETVASGATWKDKGDGTTRDNYSEPWPLMVDAKTTEAGSYSLKFKTLHDLWKTATQAGRNFAMPLKFMEQRGETEWAIVPFSDYAYLVEQYRTSPPDFTDEERALLRAVKTQLKGEMLHEAMRIILAKMGDES